MDKKTSPSGKIAGALGLAAGIAAAAGYYFYGKEGKGHRKEAGTWTKKAKAEVLEKIKQMKDISQTAYEKVIAEVLAKYKLVKNIDPKELQSFAQELKAHWTEISKQAAKLSGKGAAKKSAVKK